MSSATHANSAKPVTDVYLLAGLGLLAVRIIQGFIYWGGSRRFIYAPDKLNPDAPHWMAYKFQTAMPGVYGAGACHFIYAPAFLATVCRRNTFQRR